ncbi:hypothetical protein GF338_09980 [candidate division WOR-3 bacterium]|nr:hypothetical protein [candidate division WOR-3 bacterium]
MNYKMWYSDDHEVLYVKTFAMITSEDVNQIMPQVTQIFKGKSRSLILADLSDNPSGLLSKEARGAFKKHAESFKVDKIAIKGANPPIRMIAKIALTIIGSSDIARFFKEEEEALAWLKES